MRKATLFTAALFAVLFWTFPTMAQQQAQQAQHEHALSTLNVGTGSMQRAWLHNFLHRAAFWHNGALPLDDFTQLALQFEAEYHAQRAAHDVLQQHFTDMATEAEKNGAELRADSPFVAGWTAEHAKYVAARDGMVDSYVAKLQAKLNPIAWQSVLAQVRKTRASMQSSNPDNLVASLGLPPFQGSYSCGNTFMTCDMAYSIQYSTTIRQDNIIDDAVGSETTLGSDWSPVPGFNSLSINSGGELTCNASSEDCLEQNTANAAETNGCSGVSISTVGTGSNRVLVSLIQPGSTASNLNAYLLYGDRITGLYLYIVHGSTGGTYGTAAWTAQAGDQVALCYGTNGAVVYLKHPSGTATAVISNAVPSNLRLTSFYPAVGGSYYGSGTEWGVSGWTAFPAGVGGYSAYPARNFYAHVTPTFSVIIEGPEHLTCDPNCPQGYVNAGHTPSASVVLRGTYYTVNGTTSCVNCSLFANSVQPFTEQLAGSWTAINGSSDCVLSTDFTQGCDPTIRMDGSAEVICNVVGPIVQAQSDHWGIVPAITITYNPAAGDNSSQLRKTYGNWHPNTYGADLTFNFGYGEIPNVEVDYYDQNNYCGSTTPLVDYSQFQMALPDAYYGQNGYTIGNCSTGKCAKVPLMSPITAYVTLAWSQLINPPSDMEWSLQSNAIWSVVPDWGMQSAIVDTVHFPDQVWNYDSFAAFFVPAVVVPLSGSPYTFCTPLPAGDVAAVAAQQYDTQ